MFIGRLRPAPGIYDDIFEIALYFWRGVLFKTPRKVSDLFVGETKSKLFREKFKHCQE